MLNFMVFSSFGVTAFKLKNGQDFFDSSLSLSVTHSIRYRAIMKSAEPNTTAPPHRLASIWFALRNLSCSFSHALYVFFIIGVNMLKHSIPSINCVTQVRYFGADKASFL